MLQSHYSNLKPCAVDNPELSCRVVSLILCIDQYFHVLWVFGFLRKLNSWQLELIPVLIIKVGVLDLDLLSLCESPMASKLKNFDASVDT